MATRPVRTVSHLTTIMVIAVAVLATRQALGAEAVKLITFSGKVIDPNGRPIAAARVSAYEFTDGPLNGTYEVKLLEEATVGPDGVFSFKVDPRPARAETTIVARKPGLAIGWVLHSIREADKQQDITLGEPKQISGTVVDTNDRPLGDATVFVAAGTTGKLFDNEKTLIGPVARLLLVAKTDAQGRFTLNDLPGSGTFELGVQKPGYAATATFNQSSVPRQQLQFAAGQMSIKLVMPAQATIEGIVVERGSGKPVEGVPVVLRSERLIAYFQPAPVKSQAGGVFKFDALPPETYTFSIGVPWDRPADWVTEAPSLKLAAGQSQKGVKIEVSKGALLDVLVKSSVGDKPIPDATVSVRGAQDKWISSASDANGMARFRLAPGAYLLDPYAKGYARRQGQQTVTLTEGQTNHATVVLNEMPKVTGVVRDTDGKPVAGVAILILPVGREETLSGADGRFTIAWDPSFWGERDTTFCLVARHPQRNLAAAVEIAKDTRTVDVKLAPGVTLIGKVVDPNGKGIVGARLMPSLQVSNWGSPLTRTPLLTEADGSFRTTSLPANQKYDINVAADGYGSSRATVQVDQTSADRMDIGSLTLPLANLSVSGQVVDPAGNPVPRAMVEGFGENQPSRRDMEADSEGRFLLNGVCAGLLNIRVSATRDGRALSARVLTDAGASGIKIVLHEGESAIQYMGTKTYEQIMAGAGKVIAGTVVDEIGKPIAGVPVGVCCQIRVRPGSTGRSWMFSSFETLKATTDQQGRFAIALEEDADYNLLFSPDRYAATIVYDIPFNTKNLKVTLENGGTFDGRLLRLEKGQKVPIPNARVKIEQADRASYTHIGFDRDRTTVTDAQGRFRFEHIQTRMRPRESMQDKEWTPVPRAWNLISGEAKASILFTDGDKIENFELLIKPNLDQALSLVGSPLPSLDSLKTGLSADQLKDKAVLVCFFDFQQRPARNAVLQLNKRIDELKNKGITIIAVEVSNTERNALDAWARQNQVSLPIATIEAEVDETRFAWGVRILPWLILADKKHIVRSEGFTVADLQVHTNRIGEN